MTRFLVAAALGAAMLAPSSASADICPVGSTVCVDTAFTCLPACIPDPLIGCYRLDPYFDFCV